MSAYTLFILEVNGRPVSITIKTLSTCRSCKLHHSTTVQQLLGVWIIICCLMNSSPSCQTYQLKPLTAQCTAPICVAAGLLWSTHTVNYVPSIVVVAIACCYATKPPTMIILAQETTYKTCFSKYFTRSC